MFLATTALQEFWDSSQELLCLGSWCLRHDQRTAWEGLRRRILPCPWDDRERFYRAAQDLDAFGEQLLPRLAEYLNAAHGVSQSVAYWRVLIGPWLLHYLHAVYDRYVHLTDALARHPDVTTIVMDPTSYRVPADLAETVKYLGADAYNLQLYSQLLQEMGHRFPAKPYAGPWVLAENGGATKDRPPARHAAKRAFTAGVWAAQRLQGARWRAALHDLDCSDALLIPLMRRSRWRVLPAAIRESWGWAAPGPVWDRRRLGLQALPAAGEFERLAVRLLPQHVPTLYLEGYQAAAAAAEHDRPAVPVLVSAAAWYFDEPFKFAAAAARQAGTRLIAAQHGGGYGLFRWMPFEQHERRVADAYLAWGWADHQPAIRNLPAPKLSSWLTQGPPQSPGAILFIATCHARYLYRFHSAPVGSQWPEYIHWQLRFLRRLPEALRASLLFRPYAHDYGQGLRAQITEAFPALQWDGGAPIRSRLRGSRVVVIDHVGTTLLETLALNIPTILFWNPNRWEVRTEAAADMDGLRGAGILHHTPEDAAAAATRAYEDSAWWSSRSVQDARRGFVERHALARTDWPDVWAEALSA